MPKPQQQALVAMLNGLGINGPKIVAELVKGK